MHRSQTGFTKRYAEWVDEKAARRAVPYAQRSGRPLGDGDLPVFCGWFHVMSIKGAKWLKRQIAEHPDALLSVVAVGRPPPLMSCDRWSAEGMEEAPHVSRFQVS